MHFTSNDSCVLLCDMKIQKHKNMCKDILLVSRISRQKSLTFGLQPELAGLSCFTGYDSQGLLT